MTYPFVLRREKNLAIDIYLRLVELFEFEGTWTNGWFACQHDGRSCSFASKDAVSFDLVGGLGRICLSLKDREIPPRLLSKAQSLVTWTLIDAVWQRGCTVSHRDSPLVHWNDNGSKSRFDVLEVIRTGSQMLKDRVEIH